jgi:ABC-type transport system involved in cytochrome c biogenesis ATPase subunit
MSLLVWSENRPDWQRDALRRIATTGQLSDADRQAIHLRLRHAHGIAVESDVACTPLGMDHLPPDADEIDPTLLCGIGPVLNVDRLAQDQQLRFGLNGITLVFGENGTGKSGYARIAKKMCRARVVDELRGDVFAEQTSLPAVAHLRFRVPGEDEPHDTDWTDGDPPPEPLARVMVLDEASARIYVDGQNEITYLPREIEVAAQYGQLCTGLNSDIEREAEEIGRRCRAPVGMGYSNATEAGRLLARLALDTALANLPDEAHFRSAALWNEETEAELAAITAALANNPAAQAAMRRRIIAVLGPLANEVDAATDALSDELLESIRLRIAEANGSDAAAARAAELQFVHEPIRTTGQGTWERMYALARQFAAEAGIRPENELFAARDPCPVCQRGLTEVEVERLRRFDEFVRGAATEAAAVAQRALEEAATALEDLQISQAANLARSMAEFESQGEEQSSITQAVIEYLAEARMRREAALAAVRTRQLPPCISLRASPAENLRRQIALLEEQAIALEALPADDQDRLLRATELHDAKRLSENLNLVLDRCADLKLRQRLASCRVSLDTRAISTFATRRRRELVTPDLRDRIKDEIAKLDLSHVPLRFEEETERGRNLFDVRLDTRQRAEKSRVLSEGEQRALGIACFFAEVGRIPGRHGIIVDDPVSSLDQQRLQRVARRLVDEAANGRQIVIFTHHLVFYQEVISAAAASDPQVPVIVNVLTKSGGRFGLISENDEPWVAKKVIRRIEILRQRFDAIPVDVDRDTDEYRRLAKDFYTDLRESWERLVEEVLLGGVVERFASGVKTQSLKEVIVRDDDYRTIYAAMKRVSEFSGHDMAAGRQLPAPDRGDMRHDLDTISAFRVLVHRRKADLRKRRIALEQPPVAELS